MIPSWARHAGSAPPTSANCPKCPSPSWVDNDPLPSLSVPQPQLRRGQGDPGPDPRRGPKDEGEERAPIGGCARRGPFRTGSRRRRTSESGAELVRPWIEGERHAHTDLQRLSGAPTRLRLPAVKTRSVSSSASPFWKTPTSEHDQTRSLTAHVIPTRLWIINPGARHAQMTHSLPRRATFVDRPPLISRAAGTIPWRSGCERLPGDSLQDDR